MTDIVLTVTAEDRPGLVSRLAGVVAEHGGNWSSSRLARLADSFAGVVLVGVPDESADELERALAALVDEGIDVAVRRSTRAASASGRVVTLHLIGQDRPGIVEQVASALAAEGVGIEEMDTLTRDTPESGGLLFEARALLCVPTGTDTEVVRASLEGIANELMVDLDLDATDALAAEPTA